MRARGWDIWVCVSLSGLLAAAAEPGPSGGPPAVVPRERIALWVKDLDSDRFVDRELATEKLLAAGAAAVGPLAEALRDNNLEVTTRGILILQELALSPEAEAESAARTTLEQIAALRFTSAARRAAVALSRMDAVREERALTELKRLGAIVLNEGPDFVLGGNDRYVLAFGDKWRGTEQDLVRLRWLRDVGELTLEGPQITDVWLKYVAQVRGIATLTIKRARITDAGVEHLRNLANVQVLSLLYVPIGDPSVAVLTQLTSVGTLRVLGTNVSPPAAERLRQALTGTRVEVGAGGFLGIGGRPSAKGCEISLVRPNSAAEKGGLLNDDVICDYEGQKVDDFDMLRALIGKNKAGETVTITVLRGDERLEKRITLGEWE